MQFVFHGYHPAEAENVLYTSNHQCTGSRSHSRFDLLYMMNDFHRFAYLSHRVGHPIVIAVDWFVVNIFASPLRAIGRIKYILKV